VDRLTRSNSRGSSLKLYNRDGGSHVEPWFMLVHDVVNEDSQLEEGNRRR
jgi:hypothetical protein